MMCPSPSSFSSSSSNLSPIPSRSCKSIHLSYDASSSSSSSSFLPSGRVTWQLSLQLSDDASSCSSSSSRGVLYSPYVCCPALLSDIVEECYKNRSVSPAPSLGVHTLGLDKCLSETVGKALSRHLDLSRSDQQIKKSIHSSLPSSSSFSLPSSSSSLPHDEQTQLSAIDWIRKVIEENFSSSSSSYLPHLGGGGEEEEVLLLIFPEEEQKTGGSLGTTYSEKEASFVSEESLLSLPPSCLYNNEPFAAFSSAVPVSRHPNSCLDTNHILVIGFWRNLQLRLQRHLLVHSNSSSSTFSPSFSCTQNPGGFISKEEDEGNLSTLLSCPSSQENADTRERVKRAMTVEAIPLLLLHSSSSTDLGECGSPSKSVDIKARQGDGSMRKTTEMCFDDKKEEKEKKKEKEMEKKEEKEKEEKANTHIHIKAERKSFSELFVQNDRHLLHQEGEEERRRREVDLSHFSKILNDRNWAYHPAFPRPPPGYAFRHLILDGSNVACLSVKDRGSSFYKSSLSISSSSSSAPWTSVPACCVACGRDFAPEETCFDAGFLENAVLFFRQMNAKNITVVVPDWRLRQARDLLELLQEEKKRTGKWPEELTAMKASAARMRNKGRGIGHKVRENLEEEEDEDELAGMKKKKRECKTAIFEKERDQDGEKMKTKKKKQKRQEERMDDSDYDEDVDTVSDYSVFMESSDEKRSNPYSSSSSFSWKDLEDRHASFSRRSRIEKKDDGDCRSPDCSLARWRKRDLQQRGSLQNCGYRIKLNRKSKSFSFFPSSSSSSSQAYSWMHSSLRASFCASSFCRYCRASRLEENFPRKKEKRSEDTSFYPLINPLALLRLEKAGYLVLCPERFPLLQFSSSSSFSSASFSSSSFSSSFSSSRQRGREEDGSKVSFKRTRCYDDLLMLSVAESCEGCIITRDRFIDILHSPYGVDFSKRIKHFCVSYERGCEGHFQLPKKSLYSSSFSSRGDGRDEKILRLMYALYKPRQEEKARGKPKKKESGRCRR
ncbi:zc3h12a-like ribonuclease nyn domain protein [Cystoisospora suis]|uniref:Zc3h12a-like ribonuclease nyn domain protein n=1 Tax=Cystoisospora suis TaxID=483139 RepID=A0A2C6KZY2_9APIC|nr:zc3h12a-like ribonuclease nyn domain protein [Cystoisospora suis]